MHNGLKVYYCPVVPFYDQDAWPTLYAFFPLFRQILLRERVGIVHTHQATSVMSIECALYARAMGCVRACVRASDGRMVGSCRGCPSCFY